MSRSKLITSLLKQTAVYWANPQPDGFGGRSYDVAAEIDCRWEERQDIFVDSQGREVRSQAVVYVGQDLDMGGYLFLGELSDLTAEERADPLVCDSAFEIRSKESVPNLKTDIYVRKVWL
ncbi:MAG TPA: hypothetical protein ENO22_05670 [candidate division Zixibacteria bacterium]|nr:hypothetical protein [candidate division Zixibacteria bacterium]HEQ98811.1 hypothetical protein [candidate division Zixibacteria bacterium]